MTQLRLKRNILFIFLCLFPALAGADEHKSLLKKTGDTVLDVGKTLVEPIQDPHAAISRWFDFDPRLETGEKKNFNVLPLFVSSPERGVGFGVKFAQKTMLSKDDLIQAQAVQTVKGKAAYQLTYEFPPDMIKRVGAEFKAAYENYARFYYGMGNHAQKEDESEYTPEFFELKTPLLFGITRHISAGLSLTYQHWNLINVGNAGVLPGELPNLSGKDGGRFYITGALARWDGRNSKSNPSRGLFMEANLDHAHSLNGLNKDYLRTAAEARFFYPLFDREDHVFAFRAAMDYRDGGTPFYLMPELGGIFYNRGLIEGRFRDKLSVMGNWEYRLKIYQRLHWAFFVDGGNVFPEFHHAEFAHTKITGGTGMRYYVPPGNLLLARVDGGYGSEGLQIYLTFDQPF